MPKAPAEELYVYYFHARKYDDIDIEHGALYAPDKRHELTDYVLEKGYNVMLGRSPSGVTMYMFIDKDKFRQR